MASPSSQKKKKSPLLLHHQQLVALPPLSQQEKVVQHQKIRGVRGLHHRFLQQAAVHVKKEVENIGNNGFPPEYYPLKECQGDCDNDNDCLGDLICIDREKGDPVVGCLGGERDTSRTDYCTKGIMVFEEFEEIEDENEEDDDGMEELEEWDVNEDVEWEEEDEETTTTTSSAVIGPFQIKMTWSDKSCWQDDCTKDPRWCIQCEGLICNVGDILWVEKCRPDQPPQQLFEWVPIPHHILPQPPQPHLPQVPQDDGMDDLDLDFEFVSKALLRGTMNYTSNYTTATTTLITNTTTAEATTTPTPTATPTAAPTNDNNNYTTTFVNGTTAKPTTAPSTTPSTAPTTSAPIAIPVIQWAQLRSGWRMDQQPTGEEGPQRPQRRLCVERITGRTYQLQPCNNHKFQQWFHGFDPHQPFELYEPPNNSIQNAAAAVTAATADAGGAEGAEGATTNHLTDICLTTPHHPRQYERIYHHECAQSQKDRTALWEAVWGDDYIGIANPNFVFQPQRYYTIGDRRRDPRCLEKSPCGQCQGHCENDEQCEGQLRCFMREWDNPYQRVPGCYGDGLPRMNYCYSLPGN